MTGEVLLDEALKMMKVSERMSIGSWVDLMSGAYNCKGCYELLLVCRIRLSGKAEIIARASRRRPNTSLQAKHGT